MKKLYNKNQLAFSLILIGIYVFGTSIVSGLSNALKLESLLTIIFYLALAFLILRFLFKNKLLSFYGLCKSEIKDSEMLYYIPLIALTSVNLWFGFKSDLKLLPTISGILLMLLVGFLEEIIFRGFLFKALEKDNFKTAAIISSVTFGIGHIINLFSGGTELLPTLLQIVYSVAAGFLFVIIFHKTKSLIAPIITHSAINSLSVVGNVDNLTLLQQLATASFLTIVPVIYVVLINKIMQSRSK